MNEAAATLREKLASWLLPLAVLAAAGTVSWWEWDRQRQEFERELQAEFDTRVRETVGLFRERMLAYEQALHATHGLFSSSPRVERGDFQAFVASLRIERHPGLQGMGWSLRVPPGERERHERAVRLQGFPQYAIHPPGPRDELTSALFFEPSGNTLLSTLGTDYYAEPSRRHAMDAARDTGKVAISNKIKLPEEDAQAVQAGYRMYLPVYGGGPTPATLEERRAKLTGWIYAAFSMDGLVNSILGERTNIAVEVFDGGVGEGDELQQDLTSDRVGGESAVKLLLASQRVQVGGYSWTLTAQSLPNLGASIAAGKLRLVARVGAVASMLLALATWALLRRRIRLRIAGAELRAAKDKAEAASRAKTQFLAAASHDLRQPVQALGLFTATLQAMARKPQLAGEDVKQVANRLQLALQGLGRLLNGLFDLSGLDSGTVSAAPRPVDIGELLAELQNAFAGPAAEKGLAVRVRMPKRPLLVSTDPLVLSRVLSNLVANALRYTERGGILVGCRRRGEGHVAVQVWDTGIGIAPEELARIFGEFYQVANVARVRERGMGLGLAIAQRSAELLGTRIDVASRVGRGSVFSVELPVVAAASAGQPPHRASEGAPSLQGAVLVIDDDPQLVEALQRLLGEWGYESLGASDVPSAIAAAKKARAHGGLALVISDYQLAGASGIDAVAAVLRESGRAVPAILVSGDTSAGAAEAARLHGWPLVHKPVDPQVLLALVASVGSDRHPREGGDPKLPS